MFEDFNLSEDHVGRLYVLVPGTDKRLSVPKPPPPKDGDENAVAVIEQPTECWIDFRGFQSSVADKWRDDREAELRKLGRAYTPEEDRASMTEVMARLAVDWQLVAPNGKKLDVPFSYENAKQFFASKDRDWLRLQIATFLGNRRNFVPSGWIS